MSESTVGPGDLKAFSEDFGRLRGEIEKVIVGYRDVIECVLVTLFGGAGIDLQTGANEMNVWLDGTLTGERPDNQEEVDLGTAHVDVAEDAGPSKGKLRFFAGAQLNAWRAKAFVQLNVAPDRAVGATFGGRVAW